MKAPLLATALLLPALAAADGESQSNKYFVMVGGFWPDVDTSVRIDGNGGRIGTQLDFESDLGLDDRDALFMAGAGMRIGERHYLDLLYFDLSRDSSHEIERTIEVGDVSGGTTVATVAVVAGAIAIVAIIFEGFEDFAEAFADAFTGGDD